MGEEEYSKMVHDGSEANVVHFIWMLLALWGGSSRVGVIPVADNDDQVNPNDVNDS
jgi:hypothetical protein